VVLAEDDCAQVLAPTFSERLERSLIGEVLISGLVATALIVALVWNLPDSEIKRSATTTLEPVASATGLDQTWKMYAPDPIRRLEYLDIHVTMADGTDRVWSFREGDPILGPFSWYHLQKIKEQAIREQDVRAGFARWAVRQVTQPGERPLRVRMVFRSQDLPPPGQATPDGWHTETLFDETLSSQT
jgi:hypothetical protein